MALAKDNPTAFEPAVAALRDQIENMGRKPAARVVYDESLDRIIEAPDFLESANPADLRVLVLELFEHFEVGRGDDPLKPVPRSWVQ